MGTLTGAVRHGGKGCKLLSSLLLLFLSDVCFSPASQQLFYARIALLVSYWLLVILFGPEDRGSTFLRNVGDLIPDIPEDSVLKVPTLYFSILVH
jgi:hypothetical protein